MPGLFPRQKVWVAKEVLVYSDLNAEFNNIINNLEADTLAGYSQTVAQMQSQVDPGAVGSESLANSISGELERIRFAISRIVGQTYWYEAPLYDLSTLGESVSSEIGFFGKNQDKAEFIRLLHNGVCEDAVPNSLVKGQAKFSTYGLVNTPASPKLFTSRRCQTATDQSFISLWFKNLASGDGILYNPLLGIYVALDNTGKVVAQFETKDFDAITGWKVTKTITGTTSHSSAADFKNLSFSYSINGILGAAQDTAGVTVDTVEQGTSLSAETINTSVGSNCGRWVFLGKKNPALSLVKRSAFGVLPQSEASNPWVLTQSGASTTSVSNGILTMNCAVNTTNFYTLASAITPSSIGSGFVFKAKLRFTNAQDKDYTVALNNDVTSPNGFLNGISVFSRVDTGDLAGAVSITSTGIGFATDGSFLGTTFSNFFAHDFSSWTDVEISFSEPSPAAYYLDTGLVTATTHKMKVEVKINGKKVTETYCANDTTAGNTFIFGRTAANSLQDACTVQFERIELFSGGKDYIVPNSSLVQAISDIAIIDDYYAVTSTIASTISTKDPSIVCPVKEVKKPFGITYRNTFITSGVFPTLTFGSGTTSGTQKWFTTFNPDTSPIRFISDGVTPITISATINMAVSGSILNTITNFGGVCGFRYYIRNNYFDTSGANDLLQDISHLSSSMSADAYSTTSLTSFNINENDDLNIMDTRVWPAGEIVLLPYAGGRVTLGANLTQPVSFQTWYKVISIFS
jgi:hypothetical protein